MTLFSSIVSIGAVRVLLGLVPMIGNLFVGRVLTSAEFGEYFLFFSLASFLTAFYGLNVHVSYRRHVASKVDQVRVYAFLSTLIYLLALGSLHSILLLCVGVVFQSWMPYSPAYLLVMSAFCFASVAIAMVESLSIVLASLRFYLVTVVSCVALAWASSLLVLNFSGEWIDRYLVYSLVLFVSSSLSLFLWFNELKLTKRTFWYIKHVAMRLFRVSIHLVVPSVILVGLLYAEKLILKSFLSAEDFGTFSLMLQVVMIPFAAFKVLELIYERWVFSTYQSLDQGARVPRHFPGYVVAHILVALITTFLMPTIFAYVYDKQLGSSHWLIFAVVLLQLSKLAFNFVIVYALLVKRPTLVLVHIVLFSVGWAMVVVTKTSLDYFLWLTAGLAYVSAFFTLRSDFVWLGKS